MIGSLPKSLEINNEKWAIRSDYRVALIIFEALNDIELKEQEKAKVILDCLYTDSEKIPPENYEEALKQAIWYLDGGKDYTSNQSSKKKIDWKQDEQIIFSAVNKIAGKELRSAKYIHWWTFLGYFNEIGEGLFSTVVNIREKKNKGKKLEKYEQEFYNKNKELINLKHQYSKEEQEMIDKLNEMCK